MQRLIVLILIILFTSCSKKYGAFLSNYHFTHQSTAPDYNNPDYWAAHPWKWDPSDSISASLKNEKSDSAADVFFIYPTTYTGTRKGWNADINDADINAKTDYTTILYQASVFNQHCRIFAPRYRQAHLSAFFISTAESEPIFDTAYTDLKKAFEFYLSHYNQKRPIIIAGHSQGAKMAERLLKDFFDGKPLQKQLIAAYIIGWPIAQNLLAHIPVCKDSTQTGCFCGWRTFKKDFIPEYILKEPIVSYVTNPLSWTTGNEYSGSAQNEGSLLRNFNSVIKHTTDAQVHDGVLWVNRPHFPGSIFFRTKNYHVADVNLFYINLRKNIAQRIFAYQTKKTSADF